MSIRRSMLLPLAVLMLGLVPVGTTLAGTGTKAPQSQSQKQQAPKKAPQKAKRPTQTVVKHHGAHRYVWVRVTPATVKYEGDSPKSQQPTAKPSKRTQQSTQQSVSQKPGK